MQFSYELLPESKRKKPPHPEAELGFGALRTNHMCLIDYADGEWQNPRIVPYGHFSIAPGAIALHYGQTIFEGAKAFRHKDNEIYLFRFDKNAERMNHSASIICMQTIPEDLQMEAVKRLVDVEREWCPSQPESSLYIRPFMFATQDTLGVKASKNYTFCIMLSPSGPYYPGGFSKTVKLLVSRTFHRAVSGGTGTAKTGGNYAASLRAGEFAKSKGCAQVLYLNANNTHIEEAGAMNHYHVMADGTFIIPEFNDSILRSITSISVLELAKAGVIKARQEMIALDDFIQGIKSGQIVEAGGLGTAAAVSPVGHYVFEDGQEITVGNGQIGKYSRILYDHYTAIQKGSVEAPAGWLQKVDKY